MLKKILFHPISTIKLINRRYFQIGFRNIDPELSYMKGWVFGKIPRVSLNDVFPGIEKVSYKIINGFNRTDNMSITLFELNNLVAIEKFIEASKVVEIGTFDGGTTVNIAANLPANGKVYSIDLPSDFDKFALKISGFNSNKIENESVGSQYKRTRFEKQIIQIYTDSANFDYKKLGVKFDLFFIDGCHDFAYVKHDSQQALKYTRKGGIIIWHDYSMIEDVAKYVDGLVDKIQIYAIKGTRFALTINK